MGQELYQLSNHEVVVSAAGETVAIPFLAEGEIRRMVVTGSGTPTVRLFNRQLDPAAVDIVSIRAGGSDGTAVAIRVEDASVFAPGDAVTVASSAVGGYNTTHRIVSAVGNVLTTDQAFTANDESGGDVTLAIPAAEREHYAIVPSASLSAGSLTTFFDDGAAAFMSADPRENDGSSLTRFVYFAASATGTYRITLTAAA